MDGSPNRPPKTEENLAGASGWWGRDSSKQIVGELGQFAIDGLLSRNARLCQLADPVLSHRLVLSSDAQLQGISSGKIVSDVLSVVPVPTGK